MDHFNYYRIEKAIQFLETNFLEQPDLDSIAEKLNLSPFHFQRMFSEWAGVSPKRFVQVLTLDYLKSRIHQFANLQEVAWSAGLSSQSRVYDLFVQLEAVTPEEFKKSGAGIEIQYGYTATPFGMALIGTTSRGLCWLSFTSEDPADQELHLTDLKTHWKSATFQLAPEKIQQLGTQIFETSPSNKPLHLLVKGTNFQVKVWEALLRIPTGALTTYQEIAGWIDAPRAMQAVGSAVGANHIAWIIPCHRVIRKTGVIGEYRWSSVRKKSMIGRELALTEEPELPLFRNSER